MIIAFKTLILSTAFILPYLPLPVWKFLLFGPLNVGLMRVIFRNAVVQKFTPKVFFQFCLIFLLSFCICFSLISICVPSQFVQVNPLKGWPFIAILITPLFQSLQEEYLLRNLQETLFKKRYVVLSILMVFLHWVRYAFGFEKTHLSVPALLSLSLYFFASAHYYQTHKKWILPYAVHGGWNTCRFGLFVVGDRADYKEAQSFNLLEGHWLTTGLGFSLVLMLWFWCKKPLAAKDSI